MLYEELKSLVSAWKDSGYPCDEFPAVSEILEWCHDPQGTNFRLRVPQVRALETYWYLRLVKKTAHVKELYGELFTDKSKLIDALGVPDQAFKECGYETDELMKKIENDDDFVKRYKLSALRESLVLDYPSYIFALAMGAGKTILIGAIVATEFALAMEYHSGNFVQNALVFAPGKTIIESLRELVDTPYEAILPPRFYGRFMSSVQIVFTQDGQKDIPIVAGSVYNMVVTNTEKIRIQKQSIRKSDIGGLFAPEDKIEEAKEDVANQRLQKITSLPNLALFSDEAHHTYGQKLGNELKKVRKTVDYISQNTNLVCVVNTTGTPYFEKQVLKDVVIWYGLSEGIKDGILKEIAGSIQAYEFDESNTDDFIDLVISDFFRDYGNVTLPTGEKSKIAIYFPRIDDVKELRPAVENALVKIGLPPALVTENHERSSKQEVDDFNRLNDVRSAHRVILLVNRGTEGWDCPSLFACALARRIRSSNNLILQASSRCLRQVPGNLHKARIYLSMDNYGTLDTELKQTFGESIADLNKQEKARTRGSIKLRKVDVPPLVMKQIVRIVVPDDSKASAPIKLRKPPPTTDSIKKTTLTPDATLKSRKGVLKHVDEEEILLAPETVSLQYAAVDLSTIYRLGYWEIYDELERIYMKADGIAIGDIRGLALQIETQTQNYVVIEEEREIALALVKPDGFTRNVSETGTETYTAEISYPVDKEKLLLSWEEMKAKNPCDFGFHYDPYNFDSNPEESIFEMLLEQVNLKPEDVEDIYFTGGITDTNKTDFCIEYKGVDGRWHYYTPDFIVRRKDGRCLIVEVKDPRWEASIEDDLQRYKEGKANITDEGGKAIALQKHSDIDPENLKYKIIFADGSTVPFNRVQEVMDFYGGRE